MYVCMYVYIYIYIYIHIHVSPSLDIYIYIYICTCRMVPRSRSHTLGGTTCLALLVKYDLICRMRSSPCQGSPQFAILFATFEECLRQTSSVRQVVLEKWLPLNTHIVPQVWLQLRARWRSQSTYSYIYIYICTCIYIPST